MSVHRHVCLSVSKEGQDPERGGGTGTESVCNQCWTGAPKQRDRYPSSLSVCLYRALSVCLSLNNLLYIWLDDDSDREDVDTAAGQVDLAVKLGAWIKWEFRQRHKPCVSVCVFACIQSAAGLLAEREKIQKEIQNLEEVLGPHSPIIVSGTSLWLSCSMSVEPDFIYLFIFT